MDAMEIVCIPTNDIMLESISTFPLSLRLLSSDADLNFAENFEDVENVKPVGGAETIRIVNSIR